jgi:hypothetical protein
MKEHRNEKFKGTHILHESHLHQHELAGSNHWNNVTGKRKRNKIIKLKIIKPNSI